MVDPKEGTEVYSRDAWTGNFPRVEHKVIGKKDRSESVTDLFQLRKKYQDEGDYNSAIHQLDYRINMDYGGEQTGRSDMDYELRQRTGKALFAWQSGYQPRPKMKDAERVHEWLTKDVASRLRRYVALTPDEYHEKWPEIKEEVRQEIEKVYRESSVIKKAPTPEAAEKRLSSWVNVALRAFDAYSPSALAEELDDVKKIDARVLDIEANLDMLAKYADKHKKAYEAWIEQKLNTWFSKESYIHGTKREATLDNLTEYMLGDKARGKEKGLAFGSGLVRAYQAERMNTLADIKDRRELLTDSESSNEMKSLTHGFMEDWREGGAEILNRGMSGNGFTVRDDLMETLAKVKGEPTAEKVRAATRKMFRGSTNLQQLLNNTEVINAGVEALKSLHAELEDYMEAVPQRAVRMNEWEYAVMPESLKKNKAVMAGLRENGIRPRFHDGTEEGRKAALAGLVNDSKVGFSVTSMSDAAQGLLEGSAMKVTRAGELIKDFNAQIANWNRVAASKEGRTDARTGAEMFGTVQALLSSARKVLPDGYRGNVHTLMQWASVYAGMAETGQLPAAGALKGNSKILDAFRKKMLNETAMAADNAEAEAMLASIGEQKLNEVMVKVLQQVRGQLAKFAKDELWAKMQKVIQHAKAKEEQGKKSKRGKMSTVDYEKLEKYEQYLAMDAETVREELDGMQGKLSKADADRAAVLEAEMAELSLYGGWKGMSLQQAVAAYQSMVLFCATGRSSWKSVLDKRKAEIEFLAREMGRALPTDRTASETRNAEHTKLRKALRRLPYGAMSYSQLMLALSSRLGEGFCFDRIQEMTDANAALLNAEKARMGWMYELVQKVSGRKGELACEKWLADFDTRHDTGIVLSPMAWCEVEMTVEAAEDWLALGKEEREKQWAEREADEKRKKRNLRRERPMVPEALLSELRKAVKEYKENPRKSSGKVTVRGEYEDKGRARTLTCSRDGALYAILLHEQSDYQTVFGRPGEVMEAGLLYREGLNTPEKIRQLYDYVGPAGLRYGYALRERLHEQGLTVAQVFEAREGIPFKFRDNYFRASFDRLAVQDKNPLTDGKVNGVGGGKYGMLINRVAHHQEAAKWDMGASMVFLAASLEQDNYIFTSHITDRWRKLLLQREFATKLKAYLGDDVMKKLVDWLDVIDGAPLDNMSAFMNLSHWQGFFTGAWAASVLNGNGYVLMKQASALLHGYAAGYVPEAIKEQEDGVREVAHRHIGLLEFLGHAVTGGPISDKDLENSPYFQARRTAVGKGVSTQGHMDAGRKRSALALPSEKLGEQIEKLDAWLNRKTARALANAFYAASKKLNEQHGGLLTEEQLREGALQAVGRMLELGAQPLTRTQKGIFQNASGMLGKMTFAMKSESINKLGLMSAQMVRGERVSPVAAWVSFGLVNAAIAFLISKMQGDDDDWKSDVATAATSAITGPLSAVPVLGEGIAALAGMITGERVYSSNLGRQILDVEGVATQARKLYRHHADEREMTWEQYFQTITGLLRASGAGFGAFSRSGSEVLSSFGSLALSAAAGANVSRAGKDILCTVGLLDRPKKKGNAKSRTKTKAGQRTKRRR